MLFSELAALGVRRVVISPGARSTPLSLAAVQMAAFENYVLIDERSAAFFALGLAKADGVPAILICTSGTAAANYFPAVIEAAQSGVPLIVLRLTVPPRCATPARRRPSTRQQLFGNYARFFAELPAGPRRPRAACAACARRRRRRLLRP